MPDSIVTFTPNLHLTKLPANYRVWAQIMNDNLTLLDSSINGFVQFTNLRGPWTNSTVYAVGDTVVDPLTAVLHTALVAHTSAQIPTTFAEDSLAHPTYWTLANAPATNRGAWTGPGTTYQVNDFVLAEGLKYAMCLIQHVSGATFNADFLLGRWAVLIDLSIAGSLLLPTLSGPVDALKFVNTNAAGAAYEIVNGTTAMQRLEGILPVLKGGTGTNTSTGTGANVLQGSPAFAGTPTTVTPSLADNSLTIVNSAWVQGQAYAPLSGITGVYAPIASPTFTGVPAAPTAAYPSNTTQLATTAYVTTALASAGSATVVGTTPPGSPTDGQMWFYSDGAVGGGQLYIRYNDGSTTQWVPASPGVGSGAVVQTVSMQTGAMATGTTLIPFDDTIPQITEGTEFMTLAITPRSATSNLVIEVVLHVANSVAGMAVVGALFRDATANALATGYISLVGGVNGTGQFVIKGTTTSGSTSPTTFRVRAGGYSASTTTFNGQGGVRLFGGALGSSIVIQEVL